ncbi:hypothetical protein C8R44DRAFT_753001 [Mycena epipterygia]|nr:hypothetical protein C8R44DRAFT_753001 [Mycena epipterygia]
MDKRPRRIVLRPCRVLEVFHTVSVGGPCSNPGWVICRKSRHGLLPRCVPSVSGCGAAQALFERGVKAVNIARIRELEERQQSAELVSRIRTSDSAWIFPLKWGQYTPEAASGTTKPAIHAQSIASDVPLKELKISAEQRAALDQMYATGSGSVHQDHLFKFYAAN